MKVLSHFLDWRTKISPTILKNIVKPMSKLIHFHDPAHTFKTLRFAKLIKDDSLSNSLHSVRRIAKNYNGSVQIYPDFAPYSFAFTISTPTNPCQLAGAIIYHGDPTQQVFAVTVDSPKGWSVHT